MVYNFKQRQLKALSRRYGISLGEIADIVGQWGPKVLNLIVMGLQEGLTLEFLRSILDTLGPLFLQQAVVAHKRNKLVRNKSVGPLSEAELAEWDDIPPLIEAEEVDTFEDFPAEDALLGDLLEQFLPKLFEKFGPQIVDWLLNSLRDLFNDDAERAKLVHAFKQVVKGDD